MRNKWEQGGFTPTNKSKYRGKYPITFRSSWERRLFIWLDQSPMIRTWGSESVIVPYVSPVDKAIHNYMVDLSFECVDKDGKIKKFIVEVKPEAQTKPPVRGRKQQKTFVAECVTYAVNQAKWAAAKSWAERRSITFFVLTEASAKFMIKD